MSMFRLARAWLLTIGLGLCGGVGCGSREGPATAPGPSFQGVKIVAAAVGDPAILATLAAQRGEWSATRGGEVALVDTPIDPKATQGVDLLLFRGDRLGDLVDAGVLVPLPEALTRPPAAPDRDAEAGQEQSPQGTTAEVPVDALQYANVAPAYRDQVTRYGGERLALPYGGTALVLVYHRSAFSREENRAAARGARVALEPPATWEQLDALARFFQGRDWDGDGDKDAGIALALGRDPEGLGDATFLARAASLGQHRDQYSFLFDADSMAPRIDSPPFVEALRGLAALKSSGPPGAAEFDAEAARKAFAERKAAFLIDRAERLARWGDDKAIGVAPLPGSARVFDPARKIWETASPPNRPSYLPFGGGWLVGVVASNTPHRREAAIDLARYLVGPETSSRVRADPIFPMLAVRATHLAQGPADPAAAAGVDPRQWSDAVSRTVLADRVVPGLRIPDADGYLADLARGRVAAVGGADPAAALKEVAAAWTARTERQGAARQLWHYRRSLNSLATTPEAPPR